MFAVSEFDEYNVVKREMLDRYSILNYNVCFVRTQKNVLHSSTQVHNVTYSSHPQMANIDKYERYFIENETYNYCDESERFCVLY